MNIIETRSIRAWSSPFWHSVEILQESRNSNGEHFVGAPVTMVKCDPNIALPVSTMSMTREQAQVLFDDLYNIGLRYSHDRSKESIGELVATKSHLQDLRVIAASALAKAGIKIEIK